MNLGDKEMLSNAGKSRYMAKLIAYITLVRKEKVLVIHKVFLLFIYSGAVLPLLHASEM